MKPSDLLGVINDFLGGFETFFENLLSGGQDGNSGSASSLSYFVFGIPEFVVGVLCFFPADWIVKLAYRDTSS